MEIGYGVVGGIGGNDDLSANDCYERKAEFKSSPSTSLPIEEAGWFQ